MSHSIGYAFDNVPPNPVKHLCDVNGWSTEYVARASKLSKNVVYFVQRGIYNKIPPAMHVFFINNVGEEYNAAEMNAEYDRWCLIKQSAARLPRFTILSLRHLEYSNAHPLTSYLSHYNMSVLQFCEELALHKPVVYNYIKNSQYNMPDSLFRALIQAGISKTEIDRLDTLSREFYDRMRRRNVAEIREINDPRYRNRR